MSRNRDFGRRVKQAREDAGLSRRAVERLTGITVARLETIEAGVIDDTDLGHADLAKLSDVLNKSIAFLTTGEATDGPILTGTLAQRSSGRGFQLSLDPPPLTLNQQTSICPHCHRSVRGGRCDNCGRSTD